jgi:type IV secretion system protein VirD4
MSRVHPNTYKILFSLLTLLALTLWGWHYYDHLSLTGSRALQMGWPKVVHSPAKLEPFLVACSFKISCLKGVHLRALQSTNPYVDGATVLVLLIAPFWWILLSPRKRMLYNSRWATPAKLARVSFKTSDPKLEQGLQIAHAWAHYPELRKNRHGYLTLPSWGDKPGPKGGRVIAVTTDKRKRELSHTLIVGPTRSGKGLMITQNLLVWRGNAIINDPKGENHCLTAAFRQQYLEQRIFVIDPRGFGDRYDPFVALQHSPESLRAAARTVLEVEKLREPVFAERATNALYAMFRAAMLANKSTIPFLRWVTKHGLFACIQLLVQWEDEEINTALADFLGEDPTKMNFSKSPNELRFLMAAWATLTTKLQPLFSPGVLASSSGNDLTVADLLGPSPCTVYLRFAETDLAFTRTYLGLVWQSFSKALIESADQIGGVLPIKTLLMLDEAKAVPMPELADSVSTLAGRGLTAMIFVQDLSQLNAAYGEENAQTVVANCKTHVYFKTPEQSTRRLISERAGKLMLADKHLQKSKDGYAVTYRSLERELITPDEVERLHDENVIVFMDNQLPILARRTSYLEHPAWKHAGRLAPLEVKKIDLSQHRPTTTNENPRPGNEEQANQPTEPQAGEDEHESATVLAARLGDLEV